MNDSMESLRDFVMRNGGGLAPKAHAGVVVVGSGKGGVGTSTVAGLLALAGVGNRRSVLLVDGDEGAGSLHLLFGYQDSGPGIGALRGGRMAPEDLVMPVAEGLFLLPGGGGRSEATYTAGLGEHRALFRRVAGLYDRFDLVVVDGGSHLASVMAACSYGASRLVAVTSGDRISVAANYALLKVAHDRFSQLPVEILVNGHDGKYAKVVVDAIQEASQHFLGITAPSAGSIPEDLHLKTGVRSGVPLQDLSSESPARAAASGILGELIPPLDDEATPEVPVIPLAAHR
jgi:MinD-like ATPase involved in chromosome partitioning or flagellar assembly